MELLCVWHSLTFHGLRGALVSIAVVRASGLHRLQAAGRAQLSQLFGQL